VVALTDDAVFEPRLIARSQINLRNPGGFKTILRIVGCRNLVQDRGQLGVLFDPDNVQPQGIRVLLVQQLRHLIQYVTV
jgi:hypothetical protein